MHRNCELAGHQSRYLDWVPDARGRKDMPACKVLLKFPAPVVIENLQGVPNSCQHLRAKQSGSKESPDLADLPASLYISDEEKIAA